jgi:hypothetical protein
MTMETALERSLQSARNRTPEWTEARAKDVLGQIQRRDRARSTRGRFAVAVVGLAAAALFVARAASGGTDSPDFPQPTAETQASLALGDAGLLPD